MVFPLTCTVYCEAPITVPWADLAMRGHSRARADSFVVFAGVEPNQDFHDHGFRFSASLVPMYQAAEAECWSKRTKLSRSLTGCVAR